MENLLLDLLANHGPTTVIGLWLWWKIKCSPRTSRAQNGLGRDVAVMKNDIAHLKDDIREIKDKLK